MPRPSNADSAETIERILTAAAKVLETHQVAGLSTRRVAQEAGVSTGTVSYYFASKEDLLEACLDSHYEWLADFVAKHVAASPTGQSLSEAADTVVKAIYRGFLDRRETLRLRLTTTLTRGELHPRRQKFDLGPFLDAAAASLHERFDGDTVQARLCVKTMVFAVARHAVQSPAEVCMVTGCSDIDEAYRQTEMHLVELGRLLFRA